MMSAPKIAGLLQPARDLPIRDLHFFTMPVADRWYMGGEPIASAFFSALSATFPLGEKFFIDSVRRFKGEVEASLLPGVEAFILQEALHTREHLAFNRLVEGTGYTTNRLTERTRAVLAPFRARSALRQLGLTMALEHFTALFAHEVLTHDRRLAAAPSEVRALWRWHAMEEVEHKAIAFDVFACISRAWPRHRRYVFRVRAMAEATWVLLSVVACNMNDLFEQDELPRVESWMRALRYFFGVRGVLTSMMPGYLHWFRPGFHPWQIDDAALAQQVAEGLAIPTVAPQGAAFPKAAA